MAPGNRRLPILGREAEDQRLPVVLLSGFLGSGKTTLVNAVLRDPRMANTAVAVNEFGSVPIDGDLIDHGADRTITMANGCLCCNLSGDMEDAVMRLFSRRQTGELPGFARLIVEPSGLSDPAPIAQAILRNPLMARALRLEAIVATVDAVFAASQLGRYPETRKQIALADRIVITKTDIAPVGDAATLRAMLRDINPVAPILTATNGEADVARLFPPGFLGGPPGQRSVLFADDADPGHLDRIASVSLRAEEPLDWRAFEAWLRGVRISHADALLRVKAILHIAGVAEPVVVQGVHHVVDAPVALDRWPGSDRRSVVVLIADHVTVEMLRRSWAAALPQIIAKP